MDKKTKITSLTTAALTTMLLAGVNLTGNVKADTVKDANANSTQKAQSPKEVAQGNIKNAQKEVDTAQAEVNKTSKDLATVKNDAAKPDKAYSDQAEQVKKSQDNLTSKQDAQKSAQDKVDSAQKLADQATDANIIAAKKAVEDKNTEISEKQADLKNTQNQESTKQAAIDKANNDVKSAQSNLDSKNADKAAADTAVKKAQDALNGTGISEAKAALDKANAKLAYDKTNLDKATADKNAKSDAVKTAESKLAQATKTRDDFNKQNADITADYNNKKAASDKAQTAKDNKQNEKDGLENKLSRLNDLSKNTINVSDPDAYRKAYEDYFNNGTLSQDDINYVNNARNQNTYVSSKEDSNQDVDLNNLTDDQIKDISLFTADLVSKVRKQLGFNSSTEVTKGAINYAKEVAKGYTEDLKAGKWKPGWHDDTAIDNTAQSIQVNGGEAMAGFYSTNSHTSMGSLKKHIYDNLLEMILPAGNGVVSKDGQQQYEFGHASILLSLYDLDGKMSNRLDKGSAILSSFIDQEKNEIDNYKQKQAELKIKRDQITSDSQKADCDSQVKYYDNQIQELTNTINKYKAELKNYSKSFDIATVVNNSAPNDYYQLFNTHFLTANPASKKSSYDTTVIPSYADQIKDITAKLDTVNNELIDLQNNLATANDVTAKAKSKMDSLEQIKKANKEAVDQAQASLNKANTDEKAAETLEKQLSSEYDKSQAAQKSAQSRYNELTATNEQKAAKLAQAQTKQKAAEQAVADAQSQLTQAKDELNKANQAKSALEKEISNKQDDISKAQNELKDLAAKRDALVNAPKELASAKENLDKAKADVQTADETLKADQTKLADLKKDKQVADDKVSQAQTAYDKANGDLKSAKDKLTKTQDALAEIERQEQEAADLAAQEAQAQVEAAQKAAEAKKKQVETKSIELTHNAYVYDKDGNPIKVNGENQTLAKGASIEALSNAKVVTINGKDFYQIGENEFVKVANTVARKTKKTTVPKSAKLTHNAFVYDKNGKRVKLTWIKRGSTIKPTKLVTINGKKYYQIGKNKFIKVANTKVKTHSVKKTATIKAKLNHKVATVDRSGKKNGHHVLGMRTYKFNEKLIINGKTYYKISGKNDWLPVNKLK